MYTEYVQNCVLFLLEIKWAYVSGQNFCKTGPNNNANIIKNVVRTAAAL